MDERQRQIAQLATVLNQYAGSGSGERGPRERSATDGRSSTGSTSSGSSNSSGNAAAAFLSDLGRNFPFNYSSFSSAGSSWHPAYQGGHELHRFSNSGGGYNESVSELRMDSRSESRRVPSKGETKATPPLPHVIPGGMGSALASLQQLVGIPNEEMYRTLLAQQYAAAAAFSGIPPSSRSTISPSQHSPNQLHGPPRHQQHHIDKHFQQQFLLQQQQQQQHHHHQQQQQHDRVRLQQRVPSPHLAMTSASRPDMVSPNVNGEYGCLESASKAQHPQLSPLTSRKEKLLQQPTYEYYQNLQASPGSVKHSSLSPIDALSSPQMIEREHRLHPLPRMQDHEHLYNSSERDKVQESDMNMIGDSGGRSGSESEGDQRSRHRRKQDQPRRQSVIYSNTIPAHQITGGKVTSPIHSAESSSDDSQGFENIRTVVAHSEHNTSNSQQENLRDSSPIVSVPSNESVRSQSQIRDAMTHVLAHPFIAAHMNTSSNFFPDQSNKSNKVENHQSQYRNEYGNVLLGSSSHYMENPSPSYTSENKTIASNYTNKEDRSPTFYRDNKNYSQASNTQMYTSMNDKNYVPESNSMHSTSHYEKGHYETESSEQGSQYRNCNNIYAESTDKLQQSFSYEAQNSSRTSEDKESESCTSRSFNSSNEVEYYDDHSEAPSIKDDVKSLAHHKQYDDTHTNIPSVKVSETILPSNSNKENCPQTTDFTADTSNTTASVKAASNEICSQENEIRITSSKGSLGIAASEMTLVNIGCKENESEKSTENESIPNKIMVSAEVHEVSDAPQPNKLVNGSGTSPPHARKDITEEVSAMSTGESEPVTDSSALNSSAELLNCDPDLNPNPTKRSRRKVDHEVILEDSLSPDCNDNKRRTRQKRPVSYVEDETDPVTEMNEEFRPIQNILLSPAKKRGRKCKEKSETESLLTENRLSSPPKHYDQSLYMNSIMIPETMKEPLHIDTSCYRPSLAQSNLSPAVLLSPDIYDFNDMDGGEVGSRGRSKRGRKRGSPKKPGRTTPENFRSNISPRLRDTYNNKSSKFFSNNINSDSPDNQTSLTSSIHNVNNNKPPLEPNVLIKNSYPVAPLLLSSASIVDEVEMQLAALHKEHIADLENRKTDSSDRNLHTPMVENAESTKKPEKSIQRPMLSVVPLEQLTYEGMNKNKHNSVSEDAKDSPSLKDLSESFISVLPNSSLMSNLHNSKKDLEQSPRNSPPAFVPSGEKSNFDLSENIPLFNENFDSESESSVLYTKKAFCSKKVGRGQKNIFASRSSTNTTILTELKEKDLDLSSPKDGSLFDSMAEQNVQVVSIAEIPPSGPVLARINRGRGRKRGRGSKNSRAVKRNDESLVTNGTEVDTRELTVNQGDEPVSTNGEIESHPRARRSRRSANSRMDADASPTSSPPHLNLLEDGNQSILDNRIPPHMENTNVARTHNNIYNSNNHRPIISEAETIEDIAKFLEDTAPTTDPKFDPSNNPMPSTSYGKSNANNSYKESRPKRSSRPIPEMNDEEMNDFLLLLNMDDDESEDEDYVPKDVEVLALESDNDDESSANDDCILNEDEFLRKSHKKSSGTSPNKVSLLPKSNLKGKKTFSPCKSIKDKKIEGSPMTRQREDKRKFEERYDGKGPLLRYDESEGIEKVINAPNRDDEQARNKRILTPFFCSLQLKSIRVGFKSTLHSNYDAFNKDLSWFCAFCRNYSHHHKLGDLFGPFFVKGIISKKKTLPEVLDGQVASDGFSTANTLCGFVSRNRNKRTPRSDEMSLDVKKLDVGNSSPPVRFVPSATPARILGRSAATSRGDTQVGANNVRNDLDSHSKPCSSSCPSNDLKNGGETTSEKLLTGTECWLHEDCILWASGVTSINSKLLGLEEAVLTAQESLCFHCGELGATVSCLGPGCTTIVHVPCARMLLWTLNTATFQSFCPKHSVSSKGCASPHEGKKS